MKLINTENLIKNGFEYESSKDFSDMPNKEKLIIHYTVVIVYFQNILNVINATSCVVNWEQEKCKKMFSKRDIVLSINSKFTINIKKKNIFI